MTNARFLTGAALLLLSSACSLAVETERKQCSGNKDCEDLNAAYPLECLAGVCIQSEGLECLTSEACTDEAKPFCDRVAKKCVRTAECEMDPECKMVYGLDNNICEKGACQKAICLTTNDCAEDDAYGEAFLCQNLRCVDPVWGCLGEKDNRPKPSDDSSAVFKMQILYALADNDTPLLPSLTVKVCSPTAVDCDSSPFIFYDGQDNKDIDYDEGTGWLTVRGLRNGLRYKLVVENAQRASTRGALVSGEYYMHRPIMGETVEERPMLMFEADLRDTFAGLAGRPISGEKTGLLFARVFDCDEKQLPGVTLGTNVIADCETAKGQKCKTESFYFNADNTPEAALDQTTPSGRAGIVNLVADTNNLISCERFQDGRKYTDLQIIPRANWTTYINFYPRDFD